MDIEGGARMSDSVTSHFSAKANPGGRATAREKIYEFLRTTPIPNEDWTSAELASILEMDRHEVARRLPELRKKGLIINGEIKECFINKTPAMTWRIV